MQDGLLCKTEYLECRFNDANDVEVRLDGNEPTMGDCFKYLGSIIQKSEW